MARRTLTYEKVLNLRHNADDPWKSLANAIVEVAADDYRLYMTKMLSRGYRMSDLELAYLESAVTEIRLFFESDWGFLVSRGLAPVIWEKLQSEFADELALFRLGRPYYIRHYAKLERRRNRAEARYRKNKLRRKKQKARKKREAAAQAALPDKDNYLTVLGDVTFPLRYGYEETEVNGNE